MHRLSLSFLSVAFSVCCSWAAATAADDLVIADFESDTYGDWVASGEAFGDAPAAGTLPAQMEVSGFEGQRLVNSYLGGDDATGTLTSPLFQIARPHLNFLIGGGGFAGETEVQLEVDGRIVRTATGPNTEAGGSEALEWYSWNVARLVGRQARLRIVDTRTEGWGHITADQFLQSDEPRQAAPAERTVQPSGRYLHLPVKTGAPKTWLEVFAGDTRVRRFQIELAAGEPDFIAALDVEAWQNQPLRIVAERAERGAELLERISSGDELPQAKEILREPHRPAFHFTSKIGWLNDPNGLVYHDGTWHLFYQHNPFGWNWGNMHWGHATSPDLVRWTEQGDKIHPWSDCVGAAFSGSGLIDHHNTSGLREGDGELLVFPFTDTGAGESLAYSNDGGRTLHMYDGNPVVKHQGRDPKVIWHEPTQRWVMAVYSEVDDKQTIAFHSSTDLKAWHFESRIDGYFECPDLFELPVVNAPGQSHWVLYAADGLYVLGDFDGHVFQPHTDGKQQVWFGDFYAAQTYSDAPAGRRVQIGWGRGIAFPGSRFNQQMVVPVDLRLEQTEQGVQMFASPVAELAAYRRPLKEVEAGELAGGGVELVTAEAPLDGELTFAWGDSRRIIVEVAGEPLVADRSAGTLTFAGVEAALPLGRDELSLRLLVDRGSVEIFAAGGRVAISRGLLVGREPITIHAQTEGGQGASVRGTVYEITADRLRDPARSR